METKLEAADHCPSFPQSRRKIAKICCQWGRRGDRGRLRIGSRRSGRLHSRQCLKLNLRFAKNLLHINTNNFRYFIESICDVKCFYVSKAEKYVRDDSGLCGIMTDVAKSEVSRNSASRVPFFAVMLSVVWRWIGYLNYLKATSNVVLTYVCRHKESNVKKKMTMPLLALFSNNTPIVGCQDV